MKKKVFVMAMAIGLFSLALSTNAKADSGSVVRYSKPAELNSVGRIECDNNGNGLFERDDILFDAEDLYYLWAICQ